MGGWGWPRLGDAPLTILSVGVLVSAMARGFDFMVAPHDTSVTMSAIGAWASPVSLGALLVVLSLCAVFGLILKSPTVQVISHIALSAVFLMMGVVSLFPVIEELDWGWRAPVSYIFGSAVVHWYAAHEWFNRWVEKRGHIATES